MDEFLFSDTFENELESQCILLEELDDNIFGTDDIFLTDTIEREFLLEEKGSHASEASPEDFIEKGKNITRMEKKLCVFSSSPDVSSQFEKPNLLLSELSTDQGMSQISSSFFDESSQYEDQNFYRASLLTQAAPLFTVQKDLYKQGYKMKPVNEQLEDFSDVPEYESDLEGFVVGDDVCD